MQSLRKGTLERIRMQRLSTKKRKFKKSGLKRSQYMRKRPRKRPRPEGMQEKKPEIMVEEKT